MRSDGSICELGEAGSLLGVFPDEQYLPASYQLAPGDRLLVYSDGLEDAIFAPVVRDGSRPHCREFLEAVKLDLNDMLADLAKQLGTLIPPGRLSDDVTAVALQIAAE